MLGSFAIAAILTIGLYFWGFQKGSTIEILEDRLAHPDWKDPVYFRDIADVVLEKSEFWGKREKKVHLRLGDASTQHLPKLLLPVGPASFARDLRAALERHRASAPPLS